MAAYSDKILACLFTCVIYLTVTSGLSRYKPNWESLDTRPLPLWYDATKIGIFIHWGVFSVPSYRSEWFWWDWEGAKYNDCVEFMEANYPPGYTYADFAPHFTAEFYNATKWAEIFKASGAGYVVLTSKHHEGYTNWPSKYSFNWNSMDVGPKRDIVGELATAIRTTTSMNFGLYHSLYEWFHPLYLADKAAKFQTNNFVKDKTMPELYEIVERYKPDVVWSDGDWEASDTYWNSTEFIAWLYNDSPVKDTVVTNDRWGVGVMCHHGGFLTCSDRYNPGVLQKKKWENAMTLDRQSWGYRRRAELQDILSMKELLKTLIETISCGGNILINVGPTHDGRIEPIYEERLRQLGSWLSVNAEAVYGTTPWRFQNDSITPDVWYTKKTISRSTAVYAFIQKWPSNGKLYLASPQPITDSTFVYLLGTSKQYPWTKGPQGGIVIDVSSIGITDMPCQWAWAFRLLGLQNI